MKVFAEYALMPSGWARDVALTIGVDGTIARVETNAGNEGADCVRGPLLPGMPNVHSHAFQRAIAGRTGQRVRGDGVDTFWSWREQMYRFLERVDADSFE